MATDLVLTEELVIEKKTTIHRIISIDLLRGVVMIIMALDHTRDYFHHDAFLYNPTDLAQTTPFLFFTRWITHFCAPVFVFLAGTSAFLSGQKKSKKELSLFLLKRGLWLMVLELTLVNFAWFFNPSFSLLGLMVIWVIGVSMVVLAGLIYLPKPIILTFGILLVAGHNLLDPIQLTGNSIDNFLWSVLHQFNAFQFQETTLIVAYPMVPWVGVMALGYCFGTIYTHPYDSIRRSKILLLLGGVTILLFIVVRLTNLYGDPNLWTTQSSPVYTFLSFLNVSKYPPSFLYLLMTLGPAFLILAALEKARGKLAEIIVVYGRVPLFFYLIHIYLLHLVATVAAVTTGYQFTDMVFTATWITDNPSLKGYGFHLSTVYTIWFALIVLLYPLCKRYDLYKQTHRKNWWLSYL